VLASIGRLCRRLPALSAPSTLLHSGAVEPAIRTTSPSTATPRKRRAIPQSADNAPRNCKRATPTHRALCAGCRSASRRILGRPSECTLQLRSCHSRSSLGPRVTGTHNRASWRILERTSNGRAIPWLPNSSRGVPPRPSLLWYGTSTGDPLFVTRQLAPDPDRYQNKKLRSFGMSGRMSAARPRPWGGRDEARPSKHRTPRPPRHSRHCLLICQASRNHFPNIPNIRQHSSGTSQKERPNIPNIRQHSKHSKSKLRKITFVHIPDIPDIRQPCLANVWRSNA
jgi:hypothetical protein